MSERKKLLGAAGLAAAMLVSGPASADTLTGFAGDFGAAFGGLDQGKGRDLNLFALGGHAAAPLSDIPNLNIQIGGQYAHGWQSSGSAEVWNIDGAVFWAGPQSRFGITVDYTTVTHSGHDAKYGVFGEMYFGNVTVGANAGWMHGGGSGGCQARLGVVCPVGAATATLPAGGSGGGYAGVNGTVYVMPDLALSGRFDYENLNHGFSCQPCTRRGVNATSFGFEGEYLIQDFSASVFASVNFSQIGGSAISSSADATAWLIGVRWYTGGGSLTDKHRNGTLRH